MRSSDTVTVMGAYGHTGRFVVAELLRRGSSPILVGRDPARLAATEAGHPELQRRPARVDDAASLDRALAGAAAVINCAGPFAVTAVPVIEAAVRAGIPYLDVAAEVEVVAGVFEQFGRGAPAIAIIPAMAFYGGLGDLLATAALGDASSADAIHLAYALDSWSPTPGTRATIETSARRRGGRRITFSRQGIELRADRAPLAEWTFPPPLGRQPVVAEFTTADSVTMSRHLDAGEIQTYMTLAPLRDLTDPDLPPPAPVDDRGRSAQTFLVEVVVEGRDGTRRAVARGRDIYAITAPLVVEAAMRAVGQAKRGVFAPGEAFDARDFLRALAPAGLEVELP